MRWTLASLLVVCLLAPAARTDTTEAFFGPAKLHAVHLKISQHAWDLMQAQRRPRPAPLIAAEMPPPRHLPNPKPPAAIPRHQKFPGVEGDVLDPNNFGWAFVYVKARFECDGEALDEVALRFKGNASFDNAGGSYKRPYKLDFNRFVPGRKFRGMTALNLSNNAFDASRLRETLSYYCYAKAGVPCPRTALANVFLTIEGVCNREYLGVFTFIEEPDDKSFLKAHFQTTKGLLFKPEGMRGLPYLGEHIEPYVERYRCKTDADPALVRRFIEFVKLVNYADNDTFIQQIEGYLDVDSLLRKLAATVLISNLDSILVTNHNFYLHVHPGDGRVTFLPWDMNLSFAGYTTPGAADNQIHLSIARPWAGDHNRLLERLMAVEDYQCTYRHYLGQFMDDFFNEEHIGEVVDSMQAALLEARKGEAKVARSRQYEPNPNGFVFGDTPPMRNYIARKTKVVRAQLDGNMSTAFVPRPNPPFAFRWGIRADPSYGNLALMAKAVRQHCDADGDYKLSPREARDAVAALFFDLVEESKPDAVHLRTMAAGLEPLVVEKEAQGRGRVLWGGGGTNQGGGANHGGGAGFMWARAIFTDADEDLDGHVSLDEATVFVSRLVCLADDDQDGLLNEREVIEALDLIAAPPAHGHSGEGMDRRPRPR